MRNSTQFLIVGWIGTASIIYLTSSFDIKTDLHFFALTVTSIIAYVEAFTCLFQEYKNEN